MSLQTLAYKYKGRLFLPSSSYFSFIWSAGWGPRATITTKPHEQVCPVCGSQWSVWQSECGPTGLHCMSLNVARWTLTVWVPTSPAALFLFVTTEVAWARLKKKKKTIEGISYLFPLLLSKAGLRDFIFHKWLYGYLEFFSWLESKHSSTSLNGGS